AIALHTSFAGEAGVQAVADEIARTRCSVAAFVWTRVDLNGTSIRSDEVRECSIVIGVTVIAAATRIWRIALSACPRALVIAIVWGIAAAAQGDGHPDDEGGDDTHSSWTHDSQRSKTGTNPFKG